MQSEKKLAKNLINKPEPAWRKCLCWPDLIKVLTMAAFLKHYGTGGFRIVILACFKAEVFSWGCTVFGLLSGDEVEKGWLRVVGGWLVIGCW